MSERLTITCDQALCDRCGKDCDVPPKGELCDIHDRVKLPEGHGKREVCAKMPLRWGTYCAYEKHFIEMRRRQLKLLWTQIQKTLTGINWKMFEINPVRLWYICYVYANDLKPIRKFHTIEGGCDRSRRAALLARLISKHRPIELKDSFAEMEEIGIPDTGDKQNARRLKVNEIFALYAIFFFQKINMPQEAYEKNKVVQKISEELLFIFTHRDPQIEQLVVIARLLKSASDGGGGAA